MAAIKGVGPNIEGRPFGLIQPIADGSKLFSKEFIIPSHIKNFYLGTIINFYFKFNKLIFNSFWNNT